MQKFHQVVLVDDDKLAAMLNQRALQQLSCAEKILVFNSPSAAIDHFASLKKATDAVEVPELVLTDFNMPEMNGFELVTNLKALDMPAPITYFLLSASIEEIDPALLQQYGIHSQLNKPLDKKAFREALTTMNI